MFNWFNRKKPPTTPNYEIRVILPKKSIDRLNAILATSSHANLEALFSESFLVSETIYSESGKKGNDVTCVIEDGKITMYIDGGGGGGGEPIPVDNTKVIQLFKKAA